MQLFAPVQTDCTPLTQGEEGERVSLPRSQGCREMEASLFPQVWVSPKQPLQWWHQVYNSSPALLIFSRETGFNEYQQDFSLGCFWEGATGAHALRVTLPAGMLLARSQGSESASEKYFERWFWSPNVQDNESAEWDSRAKTKAFILSVLLINRHRFPFNNCELQLDCRPEEQGKLSRFGIPSLPEPHPEVLPCPRATDPSLTPDPG